MKLAASLIALTLAAPAVAGPISLNPANWHWSFSTRGLEWNAPDGPRSGTSSDVRGFGQHGRGVNSNDSELMGIRLDPSEQHGEFQEVSLDFRDLLDQGGAHVTVQGADGRMLGSVDLARIGPSANGARQTVTLQTPGARPGESVTVNVLVDDFLKPGGNGYTILGMYAVQNCEPQRVDLGAVTRQSISQPPVPKPSDKPKRDRRNLDDKVKHDGKARQERREDRSERGGKGKRK